MMATRWYIVLSIACICLLCGCSQTPAPKESVMGSGGKQGTAPAAISVSVDELALDIDPMCKMSLRKHAIQDVAEHQGKKYGFCSTYCKDKFVQDPEKYLAEAKKEAPPVKM